MAQENLHTILGGGGAIGLFLRDELTARNLPVRIVRRNTIIPGAHVEMIAADLSVPRQVREAVAGSSVVYLVAGLPYNHRVWRSLWPVIMRNTINACRETSARLVFFDNVYMYGRVTGPMTEQTPFNPCSRKGEVRARIATMLLEEIRAANLTALIARSADFYGKGAENSIPHRLVFARMADGKPAFLLAADDLKHSYTYTPDASRALVMLATDDAAWNQTWHLPTAHHPPTGKDFVTMAAREFGFPPRYRILKHHLLALAGLINPVIREIPEMLYQNESDYIFDSTKFEKAYRFAPTAYTEGICRTAQMYRR